jgi:hypothetical protein
MRQETGILTVAAIRRQKGERATEYRFNEKERIFTLKPAVRGFDASSKLLSTQNRRPQLGL